MAVYVLAVLILQIFTVSDAFNIQENGRNFASDENPLIIEQSFVQQLSRMIGFPRQRINHEEDSSPLFSKDEIQEMLILGPLTEEELKSSHENQCAQDLNYTLLNLQEKWALSMLDSDGKLPAGVLHGNFFWSGAHGECLDVQAPPEPTTNHSFGGKYCTLSWSINGSQLQLPLTSGLCVPNTCQESDFSNFNVTRQILIGRNLLRNSTSGFEASISLISLTKVACQTQNPEYDAGAISVLVIIYIFVFLVATGTALTIIEAFFSPNHSSLTKEVASAINENFDRERQEIMNDKEETSDVNSNDDIVRFIPKEKSTRIINRIADFFKCFCLITNGSKILDTSAGGGAELRCIHGIRFLSMTWVILGHTYAFIATAKTVGNALDILKIIDNLPFQAIIQGTYSVDSFFVMSGFLLTYVFLREMNARDGKISWLTFYLHRYWRLTPVYAIVLGFDTVLTRYLFWGPFQPEVYENGCEKTWWWNLLYINNFAKMDDSCMGWSWYLANDMQFYVISPIFLYALWKWPKVGLGIIATLFCGSWLANFIITYHFNINFTYGGITQLADVSKIMDMFEKIYIKPYTRIGPYLIGVFLAYLFCQMKGKKNFLSMPIQIAGWASATGLGLYLIYGLYRAKLTIVEAAFFNAFSRSCFSACLAWVIFACLTGHGEPVNKLLSHAAFVPLSRLTYCAYLVHPILMAIYYLCLPQTMIVTHFQMVMLFFGFLILSYGFAFSTSLLFEAPAMAIEKLLRRVLTTR